MFKRKTDLRKGCRARPRPVRRWLQGMLLRWAEKLDDPAVAPRPYRARSTRGHHEVHRKLCEALSLRDAVGTTT